MTRAAILYEEIMKVYSISRAISASKDNGDMLTTSEADKALKQWSINKTNIGNFNPQQTPYLVHHRQKYLAKKKSLGVRLGV